MRSRRSFRFTYVATTLAAFSILVGAGISPAQESAKTVPTAKPEEMTVERLMDKSIEATGGRAAYEKLTTRLIKGTLEVASQGLKGDIEVYQKAPGKQLEILTLAGFGKISKGYDGATAWSQDPFQGVRELTGVEAANFKRTSVFNGELRWKELYSKSELVGKEKVGDREAYVVRQTPAGEGSPVVDYYDAETFLQLRHDMVEEGPQGKVPVEIYASDYRAVDGIKMPFSAIQKSPVGQATVKLSAVTHNVEIPDDKFTKPSK